MKTKTIKQVLRKRFDEFANSIEDKKVRNLVKKNSIITGGAIASMLLQEPVNDYDVYFTNHETVIAVCKYYCDLFNKDNSKAHFLILDGFATREEIGCSQEFYDTYVTPDRVKIRVTSRGMAVEDGFIFDEQEEIEDIPYGNAVVSNESEIEEPIEVGMIQDTLKNEERKPSFRPVYISPNAITLSNNFQLIIRFFGDADEIHENYDFVHCTNYWKSDDGKLVCPGEALECLLTKELRYKGSKYPLASIIRTRKFINRGFTVNAGQYLKMCLQLNDMDLRNLSVLEDQLIGVDALYFASMLAKIPPEQKIDNKIDSEYLITMIDRFF